MDTLKVSDGEKKTSVACCRQIHTNQEPTHGTVGDKAKASAVAQRWRACGNEKEDVRVCWGASKTKVTVVTKPAKFKFKFKTKNPPVFVCNIDGLFSDSLPSPRVQ